MYGSPISSMRGNMNRPFEIQPEWLGALNETQGPEILHAMLYAEARMCEGIDSAMIVMPISNKGVKTPDGGIDGIVRGAQPGPGNHGIVKEGDTYYQVKTGNSADVTTKNKAIKIIAKKRGKPRKWELGPRVKECLERKGTLIVVLFGTDMPDSAPGVENVRSAIASIDSSFQGYEKIEIWSQSTIVGLLASFPSIRLSVARMTNHYAYDGLEDMSQWVARQPMSCRIKMTEAQKETANEIQSSLSEHPVTPVRVLGPRGIGRTRLVLESLRTGDSSESVIYAERPDNSLYELIRHFQHADTQETCILVVDDCPRRIHSELIDKLDENLGNISVVTIGDGTQESAIPHTATFVVSRPDDTEIQSILHADYNLSPNRASVLAKLCGGSLSIAHAIGVHAQYFRDVDIKTLDDLCARLIAVGTNQSATGDKSRRVLAAISPFSKFGYRGNSKEEGRSIVTFASSWTGLTGQEVEAAIWDLRNHGLLTGDVYLRIEPEFLHLWLFSQWMNAHGPCFSWPELCKSFDSTQLPLILKHRFFSMMEYAIGEYVEDVADELLGLRGPFANPSFLESEDGQKLLVSLAHSAPKSTLSFMERIIATTDGLETACIQHARLAFTDSLRLIARDKKYFAKAANLLRALAKTEEEPFYANGAAETLAGLFSNGYGPLSPTGTSPSERLPLLRELALSNDLHERNLAIRGMDVALDFPQTKLELYSDMESLRATSAAWWVPSNANEHVDSYENVWDLGLECLDIYNGAQRSELSKVLIGKMDGIVFSGLIPCGKWKDWFCRFVEGCSAEANLIHECIVDMLRHMDSLDTESEKCLRLVLDALYGTDIGGRLRRLVTYYDECWPHGTSPDRKESLRQLAEEVIEDPSTIGVHMGWLVSEEPQNAYDFGRIIESLDETRSIWRIAVDAISGLPREKQGDEFVGGYLQETSNRQDDEWTDLVGELCEIPETRGIVPQLICRSGSPGVQGIRILLDLIRQGKVTAVDLLPLSTGIDCIWPGMESFADLVDVLLGMNEPTSNVVALRMAHTALVKHHAISEETILRVLTEYQPDFSNDEVDYTRWCSIVKKMDHDRKNASICTCWVIRHYRTAGIRHSGDTHEVLSALAQSSHDGFWEAVQQNLEKRNDGVVIVFDTEYALNCIAPIEYVPHSMILAWAKEDTINRPNQLATMLSPNQIATYQEMSIAEALTKEFGNLPNFSIEPPAAY